jgi:hypothetical protein
MNSPEILQGEKKTCKLQATSSRAGTRTGEAEVKSVIIMEIIHSSCNHSIHRTGKKRVKFGVIYQIVLYSETSQKLVET